MKQFSLQLTWKDPEDSFKFKESFNIEADSLIQILSQLLLAIAKITARMKQEYEQRERMKGINEDDIPF